MTSDSHVISVSFIVGYVTEAKLCNLLRDWLIIFRRMYIYTIVVSTVCVCVCVCVYIYIYIYICSRHVTDV